MDRDESVNMDIHFDSISDINLKNLSFYSVNEGIDPIGNKNNYGNKENMLINSSNNFTSEIIKSKSEKKLDLESLKMLPYYIEKVSQNIKYIDSLINKQSEVKTILTTNTNNTNGSNLIATNNQNSKSNSISKEKNNHSHSTSISNINDVPANNSINTNQVSNLQNIVRKSVEGVNDILNNKKISRNLNETTGNIENITPLINVNNNNFEIIEERDEDMLQVCHKTYNTEQSAKKTPIPINNSIRKSNKIVKKIVPNNSNTNSNNVSHNNTPNQTLSNKFKTTTTTINKKPELVKKLPLVNNSTINNTKNLKKTFSMSINSNPVKKIVGKLVSNINNTTKTTNTTHIKKHSTFNSNSIQNDLFHSNNKHRKTSSELVTKENPVSKFQTNKKLISSNIENTFYKTLNNKKSQGNLSTTLTFNKNKKSSPICENCKCHINSVEQIKRSKSKFITTTNKNSTYSANKNLIKNIANNFNSENKKQISVNTINKVNDIFEINIKNFVELFYIFNEINMINRENKINLNYQILNQSINFKQSQSDLLKLLKNFMDEESKLIMNNISIISNHNNDFVNIGTIENLPINPIYEISKILLIQRKWRENKIKKILYPMMNLDLTYNQLDNFSFSNCNKEEVVKLGKLHLYSSLLKSSNKFNNIVSLLNQANQMWNDFMKNQSKLFY